MACYIYRSKKKDGYYLYLEEKNNFQCIPSELLKYFGTPIFAMALDLNKYDTLANVDKSLLKKTLHEQGYYLQIPPPIISLLSKK